MQKKLFYPAIFQLEDNGSYSVFFPDVPGCNTCGDDMEDAYAMAFDALGLMLEYMEDNKKPLPTPSTPGSIALENGQFVVVIRFDMMEYKKKTSSKAVKKTLSIPEWLNEEALARNINFSQVLQDALMQKIGIQ